MVLGKGLAVYLREIALYCWFHGNLRLFEGTLWIEWSAVAWTWAYYHVWYTSWFISHISQSSCSKKICDSHKVFRYLFPIRWPGFMPTCCPMETVPSSNFCGHSWRCWRISFSYNWVLPMKVAPSILHPPLGSVKGNSKHFGILGSGSEKNIWDAWWTQKETRSLQSLCFFSISSAGIYTYICICLEKICIFSCLSTSLWDKMWGSRQILTDAETRPQNA